MEPVSNIRIQRTWRISPSLSSSTHGTASDIRHDAVTRKIITSTQIMVSEIHRTMVKGQEVNDTLVSGIRSLSTTE
jgi:hypothetical protein